MPTQKWKNAGQWWGGTGGEMGGGGKSCHKMALRSLHSQSCPNKNLITLYSLRGKICVLQPTSWFHDLSHFMFDLTSDSYNMCVLLTSAYILWNYESCYKSLCCVPEAFLSKCSVFQILSFPVFFPNWVLGLWAVRNVYVMEVGKAADLHESLRVVFWVLAGSLLYGDSCPWGHCLARWPYR